LVLSNPKINASLRTLNRQLFAKILIFFTNSGFVSESRSLKFDLTASDRSFCDSRQMGVRGFYEIENAFIHLSK